jgi:DNA-binding NtrC family response regulator
MSPAPRDVPVLIVEDEPRMRDILERAIQSWGYPTHSAKSGEEALRLMDTSTVKVVLLDLNLPGMSGLDCLEQIRQRWPATQVVILTGFGDLESARRSIHLDVVEFLTKPAHLGELETAIERARNRLTLPEPTQPTASSPPSTPAPDTTPGSTLDDVERQHILAALARNHGSRTATAAELGISLRTLYYRISEYQRQGYMRNEE